MDKRVILAGVVGGLVALLGEKVYDQYPPSTKEGRQALIRVLAEKDLDLIGVLQSHDQMLLKHEAALNPKAEK